MGSPEEIKAKELIQKFRIHVGSSLDEDGVAVNNYLVAKHVAGRAALICVEEILNAAPINPHPNGYYEKSHQMDAARDYWQQVKSFLTKSK